MITNLTAPAVHTLDIEDADGTVRQYSFHLGTDRKVALEEGLIRAKSKLAKGARTVALKQAGKVVQIWDFRDADDYEATSYAGGDAY